MEIIAKAYTSLVYWNFQSKYNKKFHVPFKCNQIVRLNMWYYKPKFVVFATKFLSPY
jgi:hypothetical protein